MQQFFFQYMLSLLYCRTFVENTMDVKEFRTRMQRSPSNHVEIGRGEIVTIRVPWESLPENPVEDSVIHDTVVRLVCQFCTLDHDVGFGLDLEFAQDDDSTELAAIAR